MERSDDRPEPKSAVEGDDKQAVVEAGDELAIIETDEEQALVQLKVFGALLAVFDFLFFPAVLTAALRGGEVMVLLGAPVLFAQAGMIAAWGVFSSRSFMSRLIRCATLGFAAYLCVVLGIVVCAPALRIQMDDFIGFIVVTLSCLPLVFFCIQLPMWALRVWLSWEITELDAARAGSYARPVMIKDILLAMAVAAVALSLTRIAPLAVPGQPANEFMMGITIMMLAMSGVSLVTLPPLLFCILGPRPLATGVAFGLIWCVGLIFLAMLAVSILFGAFPAPGRVLIAALSVSMFLGVVSFGCYLVRKAGYRLRWGKGGVGREIASGQKRGRGSFLL